MKKTEILCDPTLFPQRFAPFLQGAKLYDSSCSPGARVWYIEKEQGFYLKKSAKGTLRQEVLLHRYFYQKGLAPAILSYESEEDDWMLTAAGRGEDATHARYLSKPERLCDLLAESMHLLHGTDCGDCPVEHTRLYLERAEENEQKGLYDPTLLPEKYRLPSREEAWRVAKKGKMLLETDTLLHGDFCLPNILLDDWRFSCFIDLGNGGVGDRHIDLFWGAWSLWFNTGKEQYAHRFLEAYGKELVDFERLRVIAAIECFG